MKFFHCILLATILTGIFQPVIAQQPSKTKLPNKKSINKRPSINTEAILVGFKENTLLATQNEIVNKFSLTKDTKIESPHFIRLIVPRKDRTIKKVQQLVELLQEEASVNFAEPEMFYYLEEVPNDARFADQWSLDNLGLSNGLSDADIDAADAWETNTGSRSIKVAVIDTGVNVNHPDIQANILRDSSGNIVGKNTLEDSSDVKDLNGHGTHVAGIIGATGNNRAGISGVCQKVSIIPIKAIDSRLRFTTTSVSLAIDFAVNKGANIINASFGDYGEESTATRLSLEGARAAGVLFVASAGNNGSNNDIDLHYPSEHTRTFNNVISVTWTDSFDRLTGRSNTGINSVDLAAPGVGILSLGLNNDYVLKSGSSMAAPHVTGAAALLLSVAPGLDAAQLKTRLLANVDRKAQLTNSVGTAGRLNVNRAILERPTFSINGIIRPYGGIGNIQNSKIIIGNLTALINKFGYYRIYNISPGTYKTYVSDYGRFASPEYAGTLPSNLKINKDSYQLTVSAENSSDLLNLSYRSIKATNSFTINGKVTSNGVAIGNVRIEAKATSPFTIKQETSETTEASNLTVFKSAMRVTNFFEPGSKVIFGKIKIPQLAYKKLEIEYPNPIESFSYTIPLNSLDDISYSNGILSFTHVIPPFHSLGNEGTYTIKLTTQQQNIGSIISWGLEFRNVNNFKPVVINNPDGTFNLNYLPAATYQITASKAGVSCIPNGFTNPVSVGSNINNINFVCN